MIRTVASGIVALAIAMTFFGVLLLKVQEPVLWIVVGIGFAMMVWNIIDGVRSTSAFDAASPDLPEGQQKRGGVS